MTSEVEKLQARYEALPPAFQMLVMESMSQGLELYERGKAEGQRMERERISSGLNVPLISAEDFAGHDSVFEMLVAFRLKCIKEFERIVKGEE